MFLPSTSVFPRHYHSTIVAYLYPPSKQHLTEGQKGVWRAICFVVTLPLLWRQRWRTVRKWTAVKNIWINTYIYVCCNLQLVGCGAMLQIVLLKQFITLSNGVRFNKIYGEDFDKLTVAQLIKKFPIFCGFFTITCPE